MKRSLIGAVLAAFLVAGGNLHAAEDQSVVHRMDIWDINLGDKAASIPDKFVEYACGTHGGPPSLPLKGFGDFAKCRPEAGGLYEVYFRYDDEMEYRARALQLEKEIHIFGGTQMYDYPIVASLLFDDQGIVQGKRIVTDPRHTEIRDRTDFWTMGNFLKQRFGDAGWACQDLPKAAGESPVGSYYVKSRCTKSVAGSHLLVLQNYYRQPGQQNIDPNTGAVMTDAFTSSTFFEQIADAYAAKEGL